MTGSGKLHLKARTEQVKSQLEKTASLETRTVKERRPLARTTGERRVHLPRLGQEELRL